MVTGSKLWSVRDWTLVRTFQDGVTALSPDGTRVLTGAMLRSATEGTLLRVLVGHADGISSAAFFPDGTKVLTGSSDKTAKLWSVADGTLLRTFSGHADVVSSVAVSPDGTQVLTGSGDKTAKLWSAADGALLRTLEGHSAEVSSVVFSPDGTQALTGSLDGTALLWNMAAAKPGAPKILSGVMLSPNGPFQIRLQGETGVTYRLEGSTNLLNWTSMITTNLTMDVWDWVDSPSPPMTQHFYRAVTP